MGQNLTQPEEVERVFREMAGCDVQTGSQASKDLLSGRSIRDTDHGRFIGVADFSRNAAHKKPMRDPPGQ